MSERFTYDHKFNLLWLIVIATDENPYKTLVVFDPKDKNHVQLRWRNPKDEYVVSNWYWESSNGFWSPGSNYVEV